MAACSIYDASRLITRSLNATPNGIDRLDLLLADDFLSRRDAHALIFGLGGPRLCRGDNFPTPKLTLETLWREKMPARDDLLFLRSLTDRLLGEAPRLAFSSRLLFSSQVRRRLIAPVRSLVTYAPIRGEDPALRAPKNAIYINASHFPVEWRSHVSWLDARLDVRPVQFIHDLLPIERPELFWASEPQRHKERLRFLARRGAAALVTSHHVEEALGRYISKLGRGDLPIFRAPPPVAADFFNRPTLDERLAQSGYFVICGTIEPRKNHQLLIDVWRRLLRKLGTNAPKLLVIGKRGWKCDHILDGLKSQELRGSVVVLTGLPTSIYKHLLAHAAALLAPALAEGFGLPIGEALALGVPVIASDIEGHREYLANTMLLIDPHKTDLWEEAIVESVKARELGQATELTANLQTETTYLKELDGFLGRLS